MNPDGEAARAEPFAEPGRNLRAGNVLAVPDVQREHEAAVFRARDAVGHGQVAQRVVVIGHAQRRAVRVRKGEGDCVQNAAVMGAQAVTVLQERAQPPQRAVALMRSGRVRGDALRI